MSQNKEIELINEIRSLFKQLIEIKDGRYILNFRYKLPPDNYEYTQTAEELISKAHELSALNDNFDSSRLWSVNDKEVKTIASYELEYHPNGKVREESIDELKGLMHNATSHIKLNFMEVLGDIKI